MMTMNLTTMPREFSRREQQIVAALFEAKAVKDIALELELSTNTVKDYLKTIYRKAQVHSARELMVKLNQPEGTPDTGLAQLLQAAQGLECAAMPQAALAQLSAAVRRCTQAQRVSFWRVVQGPGEPVLANDAGLGTLRMPAFIHQILHRGWARLEASEMRSAEGRQCAAVGLTGEVIGVRCSPTPRVQVLLAGEPSGGSFGPLDLATTRLLARLSQGANAEQTAGLSVSA